MLVVRAQKFIHVSSFVIHSVFLCQLHAHACPLYNVLLEVVFQEMNCLRTFKHDVVRRVTEFHLSTNFHVCAAVSEIGKLRRIILKLAIFILTPFLHI